jgi:integrase
LTTPPPIQYASPESILSALGVDMKGVRPKGRCRKCGGKFTFDKDHGFQCPDCLTRPERYQIDFSFKGKRIRRETTLEGKTLETFSDAHALLAQARREIEEKKFDPAKWCSKDRLEFRFEVLVEKWYEEKKTLAAQGKLSPPYADLLRHYIDKHYVAFRGLDVREIRRRDIQDFSMGLKGALSSQKTILSNLRNFFHWLYRDEVIERVPGFPAIEIQEREPAVLTREQQAEILSHIPDEHKPIFIWLFTQGCRIGEARALTWDAIDGDVVIYRRTFSRNHLRDTTKTHKSRANLIFPEALAALPPRRFPLDFVFSIQRGRPYSASYLHKIFRKAAEEAGIRVSLYEASKHSFGTRMVNEGVSMELLRKHFGHTDAKSTSIYARLKPVEGMRRVFSLTHNQGKERNS